MSSEADGSITFLFDENVNRDMARVLIEAGHSVVFSVDVLTAGAEDHLVANAALASSCVLVTHDKDFKKIRGMLKAADLGNLAKGAGKLQLLKIDEITAITRVRENLDVIDFEYRRCLRQGRGFFMTITPDAITMHHS